MLTVAHGVLCSFLASEWPSSHEIISAVGLVKNDPFMEGILRAVLRKNTEDADDEDRVGSCL